MGADPPSALVGGATEERQQSTFLVIPENRRLKVRLSNLDEGSGVAFTFAITGWQFPVGRYKGDARSLIPQKGYGGDCS